MSRQHEDTDPIEHDPTGMRALLGNLPDPGPMPQDLVARISASLADEARLRGGWSAPECPPELRADRPVEGAHEGGTVTTLPVGLERGVGSTSGLARTSVAPRRSSWASPWRVVGAAAAAVVVAGLGGLVLDGMTQGAVRASIGVNDLSGGATSEGASAVQPQPGPAGEESGATPGTVYRDDDLGVLVVGGVATLGAGDLAGVAGGLASYAPQVPSWAVEPAEPGPGVRAPTDVTDPARARACATALGVSSSDALVVTLASLGGRPAAVLLATSADGTQRAWAVTPTCADASAGVLAGPVTLP